MMFIGFLGFVESTLRFKRFAFSIVHAKPVVITEVDERPFNVLRLINTQIVSATPNDLLTLTYLEHIVQDSII